MISKSKAKKEMFVSCDLGYGAIKANFDGVKVKQDSVYVPIYENPSWEDGIDLENPDAVDEAIKNLLNKLDVSINDTRYLVGKSALDKLGQTITMQMTLQMEKPTAIVQLFCQMLLLPEGQFKKPMKILVTNLLSVNLFKSTYKWLQHFQFQRQEMKMVKM